MDDMRVRVAVFASLLGIVTKDLLEAAPDRSRGLSHAALAQGVGDAAAFIGCSIFLGTIAWAAYSRHRSPVARSLPEIDGTSGRYCLPTSHDSPLAKRNRHSFLMVVFMAATMTAASFHLFHVLGKVLGRFEPWVPGATLLVGVTIIIWMMVARGRADKLSH